MTPHALARALARALSRARRLAPAALLLLLGGAGAWTRAPESARARRDDTRCFVFARDTISVRLGHEACRHAAERLEALLGVRVPLGALILTPSNEWSAAHPDSSLVPAGSAWVQRWMDIGVAPMRAILKDTTLTARVGQLRAALPHEAAHRMVGALYFPGTNGRDADGYGTRLPDWLDDGLAQLAEFPEEFPHKAGWIAGNWARRIPLDRFLADPHPVWRERARFLAQVRGDRTLPPSDSTVPPSFIWYGQSFVFTLYMAERCGRDLHAFVGALAREPRRWPALSCAGRSPAALQPDFEDWFERRYLKRAGSGKG